MKRVDLNQRTEEWKQWRREGITATDTAVILGIKPEKSQAELWAEKKGLCEPEDLSVIPAVRYGIAHEDHARTLWELDHETPAPPICGEWETNPAFRASFDGLTADNEVLEIKCPLPGGSTLLDVSVRKENSEAYKLYWWQVQHQLLVADAQKGYLIFFDGSSDTYQEFTIERDQSAIERIIKEGSSFYDSLKGDKPPLDDSSWHPANEEEAVSWNEAAQQYLEAQASMKELRAVQDEARKKIKALMGNHQRADLAGLKVSRTLVKGSLSLPKITAKLAEIGINVTEDVLNACQGEASERWSFAESASKAKAEAPEIKPEVKPEPIPVPVVDSELDTSALTEDEDETSFHQEGSATWY